MSASDTYPGGIPGMLAQMDGRMEPLEYGPGEALPPADLDLGPLKDAKVLPISRDPAEQRDSLSTYWGKRRELRREFEGLPELCFLHGLCIANLRRESFPPEAKTLFLRMWAEEGLFLRRRLTARWLISAVASFADHGETEVQRRVGHTLTVLFGLIKLYETERLYSGTPAHKPFTWRGKAGGGIPLDMAQFSIPAGGLDANMRGRIWRDAETDPVIGPLAHDLIERLVSEDGTVFRRLRRMRNSREKMMARDDPDAPLPATQKVAVTVDPGRITTDPERVCWGIVATVKAPLPVIARWAAYHLGLGAARLHIYLDDPDPETAAYLSQNPAIEVIECDAAYWAKEQTRRSEKHQLRQAHNATRSYLRSDLDWLAHIDVDEFLLPDRPVADDLAAVPADMTCLRLLPAERLAQPGGAPPGAGEWLFKRLPSDGGQTKAVLETLYPTFGLHLREGFVSHITGKVFARTGVPAARLGIHNLRHRSATVGNVAETATLRLGHAHADGWEDFRDRMAFRLDKGSYRKKDATGFCLEDVLQFLAREEGEDGLRLFYAEMCEARPELVAALEARGLLIRRDLDLDGAVAQAFGPLPEAAE